MCTPMSRHWIRPCVSSATTRSCYRASRGKSHAAPLPAQEPPPKVRKRISVQERRARIMELVENYRASNDGKFPNKTSILRQVGGSCYTVRYALEEMEYNLKHGILPLLDVKPSPLPVKVEEHPKLKDEGRVFENQEIQEDSEPSLPKDDADLTDSEIMKDLMDKPDPDNQQREIEASIFDLKKSKESLNANDSNASDESGSDMANEANAHAREDNPKLEESANTGLLGSLKAFAYGIRNFWKNM